MVVVGRVVRALLIEGTMETLSNAALCVLGLAETVKVVADLHLWSKLAIADR
ncbi:hypothetical protein [Rhodovulum sp. ES.010]|uniref:hypothetical protein n=1 Tax=Rhodovulum sp. ES.010 TaxID=1882821 RepID=UPI0020C9F94B|nr:hypothetical protein [Rhodovulum sp. ES.010]